MVLGCVCRGLSVMCVRRALCVLSVVCVGRALCVLSVVCVGRALCVLSLGNRNGSSLFFKGFMCLRDLCVFQGFMCLTLR